MLIELAIADAYGNFFEMKEAAYVTQYNNLSGYLNGTGSYTDDTQMSLAVAEAILSQEPWTPLLLATKFVEAFKRDPHSGYAHKFYNFLQGVNDGQDFLDRIHNDSERNGAAMRATPLGIFSTREEVIKKCEVQAKITHNSFEGTSAAIAAALISHYFFLCGWAKSRPG